MPIAFPFSAIVGQDEMKQSLLVAAVDPSIGGVLVFGDRGTGKSTAIRGLAALLPKMRAVVGCAYGCDPEASAGSLCAECRDKAAKGIKPKSHQVPCRWSTCPWAPPRTGSSAPWTWSAP